MITKEKALEILQRFDFFQGQRAGRELWHDKPFDVQEEDLRTFARDCSLLKEYIELTVPSSECERLMYILHCYAVEYGSVRDHHLVEVVRCKDCKFSECCVVHIRAYNEELGVEHIPDPNEFYCAFAKMKGGE